MTFIQHEDFISDLRCNIHATKLHFFCVQLLKKLKSNSWRRFACELQVLPKLPGLLSAIITVIQSKTATIERHDLWTQRDTYCTLELIAQLLPRGTFVKLCWLPTFMTDFLVFKNVRGSGTLWCSAALHGEYIRCAVFLNAGSDWFRGCCSVIAPAGPEPAGSGLSAFITSDRWPPGKLYGSWPPAGRTKPTAGQPKSSGI